jgi:hypothetical protein
MGRRSIIQTIFEVIRNFFSRLGDRQWTSVEIVFFALLILMIIAAAILFGAFSARKRRKRDIQ